MKGNKVGSLFLVSVLALAGIGISYAGFTDTITVHGTVQTATVEFTITAYSGTWVYKVYGALNAPTNEIYIDHDGKGLTWVQSQYPGCTVQLVSYAMARAPIAGDPNGYDVIVDFSKLIPNIDFEANIEFTIGTIPVKFNQITIAPLTGSDWMGPLITNGNIYAKLYVVRDRVNIPVLVGTQVHPGEVVTGEVHITIPQNNDYQGLSGSGSATFGIQQWNDQCNGNGQNPSKELTLPDPNGICHVIFYNPGPVSYWRTHLVFLPGVGPYSSPIAVGADCVGWCVDNHHGLIYPGYDYTVRLISSYDPLNPRPGNHAPTYSYDWPCVNWIINHKANYPTATYIDFQNAIWYFVDGGFNPGGEAGTIIADALANGQNYVPPVGGVIAVLCVPDPVNQHGLDTQFTLIEVDP